jgi:hypothetical protein
MIVEAAKVTRHWSGCTGKSDKLRCKVAQHRSALSLGLPLCEMLLQMGGDLGGSK